jgi:hypothetical protein
VWKSNCGEECHKSEKHMAASHTAANIEIIKKESDRAEKKRKADELTPSSSRIQTLGECISRKITKCWKLLSQAMTHSASPIDRLDTVNGELNRYVKEVQEGVQVEKALEYWQNRCNSYPSWHLLLRI